MTTLITGGAGFIGSHVAETLLKRGEQVLVLDNYNDYYDPGLKRANTYRLNAYTGCQIVEGDVRDTALLSGLFNDHDIQRVAHLAAMAGVRFSMDQADLYMQVNTLGTMNLLEEARRKQTSVFVLASTSSVYGTTTRLPFTEDDVADRPLAPYPASKRSAEILAHSYHHLFGLAITILRFFNVYGPAGRPDMMPWRIMQAIRDENPVPIFNDGDIHRDWTYIDDTVRGVIAALEHPLGYEVINLGLGAPVSLNEFIETIESLAGKKLIRVPAPTPPSDPPITYCNNDKAQRLLGFAPDVPVKVGLERTWNWFQGLNK